jgi:hypothetical protein
MDKKKGKKGAPGEILADYGIGGRINIRGVGGEYGFGQIVRPLLHGCQRI